jgi:signal transduction histidine kinase
MRPLIKLLSLYSAICLCMMFLGAEARAGREALHVLILNSYDETSAPYFRPTELFKVKLQESYSDPITFQHVDLRQRGTSVQFQINEPIAQLLLKYFPDEPPDLILAVGPPAVDFWIRYRASTFPGSLFIAMARESYLKQAELQPSDAVVATQFSFTGAIENILQLMPDTSRIVLVFGDSRSERVLSEGARQQLKPFSDRIRFEFTNDLTIPEVQDKLAGLSDKDAVFYGIFSSDVEGFALRRYSGLAMVVAASPVPVFGAFEDQLGHGIIGGNLIQVERIGIEIAEAAHALLAETHVRGAMAVVPLSEPRYDWNELMRWNIDLDRLPQGSKVLFRPPGFWEKYAAWILGIVFIIVAQGALLITLLFQRHQRRTAEKAHASLGRRLITVHEDERRLLARELHDDLSQRLARAAIDVGFVRARRDSEEADEVLVNLHTELVGISKNVHDMSYRLHPSLVEDLGIVAALQSEIERVQRQTEVPITEQIDDVPHSLSPEMALCVFRIAQEALQNAIKHAQASAIALALKPSGPGLRLTVRDDGLGFNLVEIRARFSLGLSSMRERAALVGGDLTISSRPGAGTTVTFIVPVDGIGA